MKVALCILCVFAMASAESWMAGPYTLVKRSALPEPIPEPQRSSSSRRGSSNRRGGTSTRFFTGNGAADAGLAGVAAGAAISYVTNTLFNPCTRGGTRTNNRIFGQNTGNFLLGAVAGWTGGTLLHNAACNGR